ncbi:MAG: PAS domain-containing protein [Anaerolineales bacterium]|nr:PAS domain-containing protein [Anaerolineales bacterium]
MLGYSLAEVEPRLSAWQNLVHPDDLARVSEALQAHLAGQTPLYQTEHRMRTKTGEWKWILDIGKVQERDAQGRPVRARGIYQDITAAKLLEERLRRVEKMEAVGQLAAGMAHHYNNMLTTIIGYTSLALYRLPPNDPLTTHLKPVLATAEQAAALVRQLLAFARKQLLQPKTVSLNELILKAQSELKQNLPALVELVTYLAPDLSQVQVDPGQFEHLLLSLTTNAGEAMPRGGQLTLTTRNVSLGLVEAELYELPPGDYVLLTVKDTGRGLSDTVKAHLFEPFFTTKPVGQGTGLSLAMALGIAKQHGGHLLAESQPGQGAIFMLYLPCLAPPANSAAE